jgi:hypothetical protein
MRSRAGLWLLTALAFMIGGCERVVHWPIVCAPGDSIGFRPESGDWRQWNWQPRDAFALGRVGETPNLSYRIEKGDVGWSDAVCVAEPDGLHVVCDSSERRMRLNIVTLRFIVGSETGYRAETNNSTFDRADIALGVCHSHDEGGS